MVSAVLLIGALLSLIALASSRAILLFHEFAGHGLAAIAVGGEVIDHRLFLFGGGWIRYRKDGGFDTGDQLVLSLAGLAIEVALAALALWLGRRRRSGDPLRIASVGFAGIALVHVGFYLAAGTHHGFGDGLVLHRLLGPLGSLVVIAASAMAIAAAWWLARSLVAKVPGLPRGRWRAAAVLGAAALIAAAAHGSLWAAERHVSTDPTYAEIMRAEAEREARRALAVELTRRLAEGRPMAAEEAQLRERQLADERAAFPIRPLLVALIALAAAAGALRQDQRSEAAPIRPADLIAPAAITCSLVLLVALLSRPFY